MNHAPSRLALLSLMLVVCALLACSYSLHTEVLQTNGRVEFRFTTCGTFFYGSPAEVNRISVHKYDAAKGQTLNPPVCSGTIPLTSRWAYGSGITGCKPLEAGKAYYILADRPGHGNGFAFKLDPSGSVGLTPQCR